MVWLVGALAFIVGALLRLEARRFLHIDETVSLLAAACNQSEYARLRAAVAAPFAHWVPAREWQAFLEPKHFGCLGAISRGLAETDMHPPLYFWLLHFWLYLVPAGLATGPSLNAPMALATGVVLFLLARELFAQPLAAALAALAWAVNPCGIEVTHFARPYELLGLVSVLLAWRCVRWVHRPPTREHRSRETAILFLVSLAGLLTHYSFIFVAAAAGPYLLLGLGPKRALGPLATMALGLAASNVFHPTFRQMLFGPHERTAEAARTGAAATLLDRLVAFFAFNCDAATETRPVHVWVGTAVLFALVAVTVWLAVRHRQTQAPSVDLRFLVVPALLVVLLATSMALGRVPVHATRTRYLAFFWPFFGLLVAYPFALAQTTERTGWFVVAGSGGVLCAAALLSLHEWTNPWPRERLALSDCERIVVPGTRRTSVFRTVLHAAPNVLVFAGSPADLERALTEQPLGEVCVSKGEESARVLHVLAKHHVRTNAGEHVPRGKSRRGKQDKDLTDDD